MKRLALTTLALTLLSASAYADSLRDVAAATHGLTKISGNIFTGAVYQGSTDGTRNQANPSIINPDTVTTSGGKWINGGSSEPHIGPSPAADGRGWFNARCNTIAEVNADCTVKSMVPGTGNGSLTPVVVTRTANAPTPVADSVIGTQTTVTVTVDYNPRHGLNGWSIDRTEVTADKP